MVEKPMSKLTRIRTSRKLSLADLAKMLNPPTSATQIHHLETGARKLTEKWVNRLAVALGVSPYEIHEDSDMIVTPEERELIEQLRKLPEQSKRAIHATVRNLTDTVSLEDKSEEK